MKTRQTIGAVLAIAGLFIAVCTKDGSSHELACRFFGIALFATGDFIGRYFDGMEDKPEPATEGYATLDAKELERQELCDELEATKKELEQARCTIDKLKAKVARKGCQRDEKGHFIKKEK